MWGVCVQPYAFCKLFFAKNKIIIRSIQTSLHTSKEVVDTRKGKMHVSPWQNYPLHRYFQFTGWKMNTLSSSARRVYNSLLWALWSADCTRNRRGVKYLIYGISLWFIPCSISILDNCFWRNSFSRKLFLPDYSPPATWFRELSVCLLVATIYSSLANAQMSPQHV